VTFPGNTWTDVSQKGYQGTASGSQERDTMHAAHNEVCQHADTCKNVDYYVDAWKQGRNIGDYSKPAWEFWLTGSI
jgi:hypothetical protein